MNKMIKTLINTEKINKISNNLIGSRIQTIPGPLPNKINMQTERKMKRTLATIREMKAVVANSKTVTETRIATGNVMNARKTSERPKISLDVTRTTHPKFKLARRHQLMLELTMFKSKSLKSAKVRVMAQRTNLIKTNKDLLINSKVVTIVEPAQLLQTKAKNQTTNQKICGSYLFRWIAPTIAKTTSR